MAEGDLTKERTLNKIEIVSDWVIQIREIDGVYEEQKDGSKKLISSNYHILSLVPYLSLKEADGSWKHTDTDLSKENTKIKGIAETCWDSDTKTAYKTFTENQEL